MIVKLLTEHHLEFLSLKGGCRGLSESHLSNCQIVGNLMPGLNISSFIRILHVVVVPDQIASSEANLDLYCF